MVLAQYERPISGSLNLKPNYGAEFQYFVTDNLAFNYRTNFSSDRIHVPASIPLLAAGCYYSFSDASELLFIPEGITYYFNLFEGLSIGPYINPIGFDYLLNSELAEHERWAVTCSAGTRINAHIAETVVISQFAEYQFNYNNRNNGLNTGISFGLNVPY